jgi:hypothetical protein
MIATATTANRNVNRVKPGDGKAHPVNHEVRIVVVRPAAGASAATESHGSGHSQGLTKDQLEAAEEELKRMGAPPSSGGTAAAHESLANNMFDVLKPTDIVVVGRETASVRMVDSSGKPVSAHATTGAVQTASEDKPRRRLVAHEHHYTDTVLPVWTGSDTIEYQCDVKFEIVKVERAGWKIYGAPENPFKGKLPYRAEERPRAPDGARIWVWKSSVLPAKANNQQYKMAFRIFDENGENGQDVDPDVVCGNPPPSP